MSDEVWFSELILKVLWYTNMTPFRRIADG